MNKNIILFSKRAKLAEEYEKWVNQPLADGAKIKDCPLSVITFMVSKGFVQIPEGSVVLSKEEYSDYLILQKTTSLSEKKQKDYKQTTKDFIKILGNSKRVFARKRLKRFLCLYFKN